MLDAFFQSYNGRHIDYDGDYGPQCKDLFSYYNRDVVGNPNYVYGNAWELWENAPTQYYRRITKNPQRGDIAIWAQSFGGFGHVAIVWGNETFFSQNYPETTQLYRNGKVKKYGTPCSIQSIPKLKIVGYLRPLNLEKMSIAEKFENMSIVNAKTGAKAFVKSGKRNMYGHVIDGVYKEPGFSSDYEHANFIATAVFVSEKDWNDIPQSNVSAHDVLHGHKVL